MAENLLRRLFWLLNHFFMIPVFRMGLGALIGTPPGGYIMLIRTVGRRSGKVRYAPVNYAIIDGCVYCIAGFGHISDWFLNLQSAPDLELIMPGGALAGHMETVSDLDERGRAARQILRNGGFAGFMLGFNPHTVPEERLQDAIKDLPILRICPTGIGSGPFDPGGLSWLTWLLITFAVIAALLFLPR